MRRHCGGRAQGQSQGLLSVCVQAALGWRTAPQRMPLRRLTLAQSGSGSPAALVGPSLACREAGATPNAYRQLQQTISVDVSRRGMRRRATHAVCACTRAAAHALSLLLSLTACVPPVARADQGDKRKHLARQQRVARPIHAAAASRCSCTPPRQTGTPNFTGNAPWAAARSRLSVPRICF